MNGFTHQHSHWKSRWSLFQKRFFGFSSTIAACLEGLLRPSPGVSHSQTSGQQCIFSRAPLAWAGIRPEFVIMSLGWEHRWSLSGSWKDILISSSTSRSIEKPDSFSRSNENLPGKTKRAPGNDRSVLLFLYFRLLQHTEQCASKSVRLRIFVFAHRNSWYWLVLISRPKEGLGTWIWHHHFLKGNQITYPKMVVRDQHVMTDTGTLALPIGRGGNSKDSSTVSQLKVTPWVSLDTRASGI